MKNNHVEIQNLMNQGRIHSAISMAKDFILKHGDKESQLEIFLLAKCYFAIGKYQDALYYVRLTEADPINRIPLQEEIESKLF